MDRERTTRKTLPWLPPRKGKSETIKLFNGKDLTGWEGHEKYWSVKDGVIVGKNTEPVPVSTYLLTKRKFTRFPPGVRFKLVPVRRCTPASPCGAGSRRKRATSTPTPATWSCSRPATASTISTAGTGSTTTAAKAKKVGKQHDWNQIEILAQGNRIRFVLNGVLISDWRDPKPETIKEAPDRPATALEQGAAGSAVEGPDPGDVPRGQAHHGQGVE